MVFWNQATFVTYHWNGQERKAQLLSAVVCDGYHKYYAVANEELNFTTTLLFHSIKKLTCVHKKQVGQNGFQ